MLANKPRWETYADEIVGKDTPELAAAVEEYAKHQHDARSNSQNEEELARWQEGNREIAKEYQFVKPEEYADEGPRIGRILHSSEIINILRNKCGLNCWYREHPQPQKLTLLVQPNAMLRPEVGCWAMYGYAPEYSIVRFDSHGVPLDEKYRGWRTVLMQLRLKGLLTEERINKAFGQASGPAATRYLTFMQSMRNNYGLGAA